MTLALLLSELYRRTSYPSAPHADVVTKFTAFLNTTHHQILTTPGLEHLRDLVLTFASVANQARYSLPPVIAQIKAITQADTQRRIRFLSLDDLRSGDPGPSGTGSPDGWVPMGYQPVAQQPSDASELFIKSTAAGDTNAAYLEGIRTGGYPVSLGPITMTGVTAKSLSTTITDLIAVTKVYLSVAAVGSVTLHEDSGIGTELARIAIGQTFARYLGIQLWPTPSAVETFTVDCVRTIPELITATDEPLLPEDFHYLLVEGALIKEFTKKDDTRRSAAAADYAAGMKALRTWICYPPDYDAGLSGVDHGSNLGSYYPSGRW